MSKKIFKKFYKNRIFNDEEKVTLINNLKENNLKLILENDKLKSRNNLLIKKGSYDTEILKKEIETLNNNLNYFEFKNNELCKDINIKNKQIEKLQKNNTQLKDELSKKNH